MKLKNTLRHIMGEDLITHLGLDYYGGVNGTLLYPVERPCDGFVAGLLLIGGKWMPSCKRQRAPVGDAAPVWSAGRGA